MAAKKKAKPRTESTVKAPKEVVGRQSKVRLEARGSAITISTHPFAPGDKVSFLPVHEVSVQRSEGRAPLGTPVQTATVAKDGTLEVRGLPNGDWCAAGEVDGRTRYVQFPVRGGK